MSSPTPTQPFRLSAGAKLGRYDILDAIGAGGMGEVYRARDTQLGREVALKVLPRNLSSDEEYVKRFQREAQAIAALNHPNILAIFDVGKEGNIAYIVTELLNGAPLSRSISKFSGKPRRVAELGSKIASGLAAAHEHGIVHRDLKPENIFITSLGQPKILDFGLAKTERRISADDATQPYSPTPTTQAGRIMGTPGYMSPEQIGGDAIDNRTDLFSLGVVLYEAFIGARPFIGKNTTEVFTATLRDEPPDLLIDSVAQIDPLRKIIGRCLHKKPGDRFQCASDLAFALEQSVLEPLGSRYVTVIASKLLMAAMGLLALSSIIFLLIGRHIRSVPEYRQITFRRGKVESARFSSDGHMVYYAGAWDGGATQIFSVRTNGTESALVNTREADLLAVSSDEMAIALLDKGHRKLARIPLNDASSPRVIADDVVRADFGDNGQLAVVREIGGKSQLEYPIDNQIYQTSGAIDSIRFSADRTQIAFIENPESGETEGVVKLISAKGGKAHSLTQWYAAIAGLAWNKEELWFCSGPKGSTRELKAVTPSGRERLVTRVPGSMSIQDVDESGQLLLTEDHRRTSIMVRLDSDTKERDVSWLDLSTAEALSADGKTLLFDETGEGGGQKYSTYIRPTSGKSSPTRLGDGAASAISPDGKAVLAIQRHPSKLVILPIEGSQYEIEVPNIERFLDADWITPGSRILFEAISKDGSQRLFVVRADGGDPRPVSPSEIAVFGFALSNNGKVVAVQVAPTVSKRDETYLQLYDLDSNSPPRSIAGSLPGDIPTGWSSDDRSIYIYKAEMPSALSKLDLRTGTRTLIRELAPSDLTGVTDIVGVLVTPDGHSYAYTYERYLTDLYVADGLH